MGRDTPPPAVGVKPTRGHREGRAESTAVVEEPPPQRGSCVLSGCFPRSPCAPDESEGRRSLPYRLPPKSMLTVHKLFPFYLGTNLTEKRKERGEKWSKMRVCGRRGQREEARFVGLAKATPSLPVSRKEAFSLLTEPHVSLWRLDISKIHLSRVVAIFLVFCCIRSRSIPADGVRHHYAISLSLLQKHSVCFLSPHSRGGCESPRRHVQRQSGLVWPPCCRSGPPAALPSSWF